MAGYRETSSYDPDASARYGRPLRPFNWVQWTGVTLIALGVVLNLAFLAGDAGWLPKWRGLSSLALLALIFGAVLVNSRRQSVPPAEEEQRRHNVRVLLITTAIVVPMLIAAAAIDLLGAK